MRYFWPAVTAACGVCALLIACEATDGKGSIVGNKSSALAAVTPQQSSDGARRVKVDELREALGKKEALVVDVRGEGSYKAGHIRGALWIPEGEIAGRSGELPRDKMIVTYCS